MSHDTRGDGDLVRLGSGEVDALQCLVCGGVQLAPSEDPLVLDCVECGHAVARPRRKLIDDLPGSQLAVKPSTDERIAAALERIAIALSRIRQSEEDAC